MKRFLIEVTTNWCGMDQEYVAIANSETELLDLCDQLAYDNFESFDCFKDILEELFPDVEDGEYSDDQTAQAIEVESEYFGGSVQEWDETRDEEEWSWYELVYDASDGTYEYPKKLEENAEV